MYFPSFIISLGGGQVKELPQDIQQRKKILSAIYTFTYIYTNSLTEKRPKLELWAPEQKLSNKFCRIRQRLDFYSHLQNFEPMYQKRAPKLSSGPCNTTLISGNCAQSTIFKQFSPFSFLMSSLIMQYVWEATLVGLGWVLNVLLSRLGVCQDFVLGYHFGAILRRTDLQT